MTCFECDAPADHMHHVVPQSRGGTRTVPLCGACHGQAHDLDGLARQSDLTREGLSRRRAAGLHTGGQTPYGYRLEGETVVEDPEEQATITLARKYRAHNMSLRDIAATLALAGRFSRTRKVFVPSAIHSMLQPPTNVPGVPPSPDAGTARVRVREVLALD